MFDAKSILDALVTGGQQQSPAAGGGLGDLLGQILGGAQQQPGARNAAPDQGGGLGDLLGQALGGGQQSPGARNVAPGQESGGGLGDILGQLQKHLGQGQGGGQGGAETGQPGAQSGGGLGDILGELQRKLGPQASGSGGQGGGLMDILGQVLGQATSGVKEGAQRIDDATGIGRGMRQGVEQATGKSPDDLLAQLKDLIENNKVAAGAGLGGLGALVLGTRTGRSLAGSAARIGALALIGGLAYKAYQNYTTGRPLIAGEEPAAAAPQGTGFEPQAITNETATLYIQAMIGAAAADGRIDENEQTRILGGLKQAGLDAEAEEFLAQALNNPATPADLAAAVRSGEEAVQVFTAARMAIDPDTNEEHAFLSDLASRLGIDANLANHVDAATRNAA